jgi:predicted NBD/HSP70 family sugar kinase
MAINGTGASRARTRGTVLDLIRAAGTVSRAELTAASGLTWPTITNLVRDLIADGLVIETGHGVSTGGKRPTLLRLNPQARYSVGVQFERNMCVIVICDLAGRPVSHTSLPGPAAMPPERALPIIAAQVDVQLAAAGVERSRVLGVGVVSYGPQDSHSGALLTPQPTAEWLGYPVARSLMEILQLPVLLDNDANAAAIGEYWLGTADASTTYGCIYMATGIGGAVVVGGTLYRGSNSNSVEIGHISLNADGEECTCGNRGCLENYAGPSAVVRQALAIPGLAARLGLDRQTPDVLTAFARIIAAAADDPTALALLERSARYLGSAAVTMTNLFDLDLIVLAGPSFGAAGPIYQAVIEAEVRRRGFVQQGPPVRVVSSANGSIAAAVGGAVLVLQNELTSLDRPALPNGRPLAYSKPGSPVWRASSGT